MIRHERASQIAFATEVADLKAAYGHCRCPELKSVDGRGAFFYTEHLTWIDELGPGSNVYLCPVTRNYWARADARGGHALRMERFDTEQAAVRRAREFG